MYGLRKQFKKLRNDLHLTQEEVGNILGLSTRTINRYECFCFISYPIENYINVCVKYPDIFYYFASEAFIERKIGIQTLNKFIGRFDY